MPLEQIGVALTFEAFFTASKVGKTGLTVTVDVYKSDGTLLVSGGSATAIGGGLYKYTLASGSNDAEELYTAIFKTTDTTVDVQHRPSLWSVQKAGVENLDAKISTRIAVVDSGTLQAGGASSATLRSGSVATDGFYAGLWLVLTGGTGAGQCRLVTAYNGTTKVATLASAWTTQPDGTSTYALLPAARVYAYDLDATAKTSVENAVLEATAASHDSAGTIGNRINNVDVDVSSRSSHTAADVWAVGTRTLTAFSFAVDLSAVALQAIWDKATLALTTAGSIGKLIVDNLDAKISTRLATASYTAPPSAASIADAVWDEQVSDHTTAGSTGARVSQIATGLVQVAGPVASDGSVTIRRRDDYYAADGRALEWTEPSAGAWPDLTGASVRVEIGTTSFTGSVVTPTGTKKVRLELTTAQTAALKYGAYPIAVEATLSNNHVVTLATGTATVSDDPV